MIFSRLLCNICTHLTIGLVFIAVLGDYLTKLSNNPITKALCDNITHAVIGGLSWCICYINSDRSEKNARRGLFEILSCTIISSIIDVDHFLAAKSVLLKDATRLKHRPFLHCSTIPLVLFIVLLVTSYILESPLLKKGALIILTAFTTHHIRDATRRGMWFYPYGSTPPVPYFVYIILTCAVPYVIIIMDRFFKVIKGTESNSLPHVTEMLI